jgi:hypothetical protein
LLSFTTATQAALKGIIGDILLDRASEILTLPALQDEEAVEFVLGLLREWSLDPGKSPAPFTPSAISSVVKAIRRRNFELTPRTVIKHFNAILRDADLDIEDGVIDAIDEDYALEHLGADEDSE